MYPWDLEDASFTQEREYADDATDLTDEKEKGKEKSNEVEKEHDQDQLAIQSNATVPSSEGLAFEQMPLPPTEIWELIYEFIVTGHSDLLTLFLSICNWFVLFNHDVEKREIFYWPYAVAAFHSELELLLQKLTQDLPDMSSKISYLRSCLLGGERGLFCEKTPTRLEKILFCLPREGLYRAFLETLYINLAFNEDDKLFYLKFHEYNQQKFTESSNDECLLDLLLSGQAQRAMEFMQSYPKAEEKFIPAVASHYFDLFDLYRLSNTQKEIYLMWCCLFIWVVIGNNKELTTTGLGLIKQLLEKGYPIPEKIHSSGRRTRLKLRKSSHFWANYIVEVATQYGDLELSKLIVKNSHKKVIIREDVLQFAICYNQLKIVNWMLSLLEGRKFLEGKVVINVAIICLIDAELAGNLIFDLFAEMLMADIQRFPIESISLFLEKAIEKGATKTIALLLEQKKRLERYHSSELDCLISADAAEEKFPGISELFWSDVPLTAQENQDSFLIHFDKPNKTEILKRAIEQGAKRISVLLFDINDDDKTKFEYLLLATQSGHLVLAKLIHSRFEVNLFPQEESLKFDNVLLAAIKSNKPEVVQWILEEINTNHQQSMLNNRYATNNLPRVVGYKLNSRYEASDLPLVTAYKIPCINIEIIMMLLENGADANDPAITSDLCARQHPAIISKLLQAGCRLSDDDLFNAILTCDKNLLSELMPIWQEDQERLINILHRFISIKLLHNCSPENKLRPAKAVSMLLSFNKLESSVINQLLLSAFESFNMSIIKLLVYRYNATVSCQEFVDKIKDQKISDEQTSFLIKLIRLKPEAILNIDNEIESLRHLLLTVASLEKDSGIDLDRHSRALFENFRKIHLIILQTLCFLTLERNEQQFEEAIKAEHNLRDFNNHPDFEFTFKPEHNFKDYLGRTVLQVAAENFSVDAFYFLFRFYISIKNCDRASRRAFDYGDADEYELFHYRFPNEMLNFSSRLSRPLSVYPKIIRNILFLHAIAMGHIDEASYLLAKGVDPNTQTLVRFQSSKKGKSALTLAIGYGNAHLQQDLQELPEDMKQLKEKQFADFITRLLELGANLEEGVALINHCQVGNFEIIFGFLNFTVSTGKLEATAKIAQRLAVTDYSEIDKLRLIIALNQYQIDAMQKGYSNIFGELLTLTASLSNRTIMEVVVDFINSQDNFFIMENQPIINFLFLDAAKSNAWENVEELLPFSDVNAYDQQHFTVLDFAIINHNSPMVAKLLAAGANARGELIPNGDHYKLVSPLKLAVIYKAPYEIIEQLINALGNNYDFIPPDLHPELLYLAVKDQVENHRPTCFTLPITEPILEAAIAIARNCNNAAVLSELNIIKENRQEILNSNYIKKIRGTEVSRESASYFKLPRPSPQNQMTPLALTQRAAWTAFFPQNDNSPIQLLSQQPQKDEVSSRTKAAGKLRKDK